jgi:NAD-reducing hydrogenase small subunit
MANKVRLATVWLGGCSGCHMSFLDLDEKLIDLASAIELVYSPIADVKEYPHNVDVVLIEGALCNTENLELLLRIRERSKILISFGDCAVTGNTPQLRNKLDIDDVLTKVYQAGPGSIPKGPEAVDILPVLLPRVYPLHAAVPIDVYLPGCPPDPDRIYKTIAALLAGEKPQLPAEAITFG